jgi:hypothetical protein
MKRILRHPHHLPTTLAPEGPERPAIFTPGPLAGAISGSIGGSTYSHNRGGPYIRRRATPVTSTTQAAMAAKNRMAAGSQAWQALTAGQRLAWKEWALENPALNALGQTITLTGHQAFCGNFSRCQTAGVATLTAPPITPAPTPLATTSITGDIGVGTIELTYTATPLGATEYLWLVANVANSAGINYVENTKRFIGISAAAQASPFDYQTLIEAVFGTLVVDQIVHMFSHVFDSATGLLSTPQRDQVTVVST